jgi:hypothetical protein
MMCSRLVRTSRPIATVHLADGLADHGERVVADLAVGPQIVGADQVARVDLAAVDELVDLDGARGFQRDVLEFFLADFDVGVGVDLEALDDVFVLDLLAGVGVHLGVLDAVPGLPVQLVERDLLALRGGQVKRYRTGDEREAEKPFPIGAWGHVRRTPLRSDSRRMGAYGSDIMPAEWTGTTS